LEPIALPVALDVPHVDRIIPIEGLMQSLAAVDQAVFDVLGQRCSGWASLQLAFDLTHTQRHPAEDLLSRVMIMVKKSFRKALDILSTRRAFSLPRRRRNNS
jgi:hypothetical protein